ncbi:basic leucine zipper 43 isoform X2 [Vigna radiata var. radiata]|uniref:Basic leucine zipper 43 isoform X2 n=1 Tax=Vigna radiata var. radiata TaxID=3916 RepID=A0A3Q0FAH5_VIGRR|nr:basic leucine zipper 43 isoform X2 [Vigna radiata var. radiata]
MIQLSCAVLSHRHIGGSLRQIGGSLEVKKKRMFSNRESARRSRMRKKQQIEVLQYHVDHLQTLNHQLSQKIIYLLECNQQIHQQNSQLKEKVSSLQVVLSDLLVPAAGAEQPHHIPNGFPAEPSSTRPIASSRT